jgi:hypothetical protein
MVRAGVPERVAMQISGHRTRAVFDRYHIVSESDLRQAAAAMEEHRRKITSELDETNFQPSNSGQNRSEVQTLQ